MSDRSTVLALGAFVSSAVLALARAHGQTAAPAPATTPAPPPVVRHERPAALVSPEVAPDRRVTFRLRAPGAREVKVTGGFGPKTGLTRDAEGIWSATVGPVEPGVHEYSFVVDG